MQTIFSNTSGSVPFLLTGNSECMASAHRKGGRISLLPCSTDNILIWIALLTIVKHDDIFVLLSPMIYRRIASNYLQIYKQHLLQKAKNSPFTNPLDVFGQSGRKMIKKIPPNFLGGMVSDSLMKIILKFIV